MVASSSAAADGQPAAVSDRVQKVADEICGMTVLEVADLHELLKKRLRIEAGPAMSMPMGLMAAMPAPSKEQPKEEEKKVEKTTFSLILEGFDAAKKIGVIKEVRAATGLGLKEAKELVEGAPKTVKENLPKADAEQLMKKLAEAGAKVKMD